MSRRRLAIAGLVLAGAVGAVFVAAESDDVRVHGERARGAWSEVRAQYDRRTALVPDLLAAFRALAPRETEVSAELGAALDKVRATPVDGGAFADAARFNAFADAQSRLSAALHRLGETIERYPELKGNTPFMLQLAGVLGAEDRIVLARRDYIAAAWAHNRQLSRWPDRWVAALVEPEARPLPIFLRPELNRPGARG